MHRRPRGMAPCSPSRHRALRPHGKDGVAHAAVSKFFLTGVQQGYNATYLWSVSHRHGFLRTGPRPSLNSVCLELGSARGKRRSKDSDVAHLPLSIFEGFSMHWSDRSTVYTGTRRRRSHCRGQWGAAPADRDWDKTYSGKRWFVSAPRAPLQLVTSDSVIDGPTTPPLNSNHLPASTSSSIGDILSPTTPPLSSRSPSSKFHGGRSRSVGVGARG